jgi:hypothetical protein
MTQTGQALYPIALACGLMLMLQQTHSQPVDGQADPTALVMAQTLLDPKHWNLVKFGKLAPSFKGPKGSSKLIKDWSSRNDFEQGVIPAGAVKFTTPSKDGKPATITLKFSAESKVGERVGGE